MGILDFILNKKKESCEIVEDKKEDVKTTFTSDISMVELENVDYWDELGSVLKQKRLLPASYPKKPDLVEVSLGKNNRPYARLTFNSSSSSSVRQYLLLQDGVFEYVNGAIDDGKNPELNDVWSMFQERIRRRNSYEKNWETNLHIAKGRKLQKQAKELIGFESFFDRENEFLEKHQSDVYGGFGVEFSQPVFLVYGEGEDGQYTPKEKVAPFSPKTLEFCCSRLSPEAKAEEGEYLDYFLEKCRRIQGQSVYETEDWDKTINKLAEIVKASYQVSVLNSDRCLL